MNNWFLRGDFGATPTNYSALIIALLLAFACGHAIAWIYMLTHSGLSYSRSYVTTLIIMPVIVAMVMLILANNLVLAFGLMAIFAMVRFRSILRDTLDTTYVLAERISQNAAETHHRENGHQPKSEHKVVRQDQHHHRHDHRHDDQCSDVRPRIRKPRMRQHVNPGNRVSACKR